MAFRPVFLERRLLRNERKKTVPGFRDDAAFPDGRRPGKKTTVLSSGRFTEKAYSRRIP